MPRPKHNFNPPPDLLDRLPRTSRPSRADMLKLLDSIPNHVGSLLSVGTNRPIYNAIVETIRAQKGSAPAGTGAPSRPEQWSEGASSIPEKVLERKIGQDLILKIEGHTLNLYAFDELSYCLSPGLARDLATALNELADDLEQDANARAWSKSLLEATTE